MILRKLRRLADVKIWILVCVLCLLAATIHNAFQALEPNPKQYICIRKSGEIVCRPFVPRPTQKVRLINKTPQKGESKPSTTKISPTPKVKSYILKSGDFNAAATGTNPSPTTTSNSSRNFISKGASDLDPAAWAHMGHMDRPEKVRRVNTYWQIVNSTESEIYLYSAYYDDRIALDAPVLRVIGIAEYSIKRVFCALWYRHKKHPDVSVGSRAAIGADYMRHGKALEGSLFTCALLPGQGIPNFVSILLSPLDKVTTYLRVRIPEKPEKTIAFGNCVSVAYWHHDPWKVVEWIELQRLWGVQEITIYNNSLDAQSSKVYAYYASRGIVDIRQAPNAMADPGVYTILLNMSPVINDCMYRNMYRYNYVTAYDIDEVIVPRQHDNYYSMMKSILDIENEKTHAVTLENYKSFMFTNVYFFLDFKPVRSVTPSSLITQRYLKRVAPSEYGYSVKSFTDPKACIGMQNHLCWIYVPKYENAIWNYEVPQRISMNHHYKKCHFDYHLGIPGTCKNMSKVVQTDRTMLRFGKDLMKAVRIALDDLGLSFKKSKRKQFRLRLKAKT